MRKFLAIAGALALGGCGGGATDTAAPGAVPSVSAAPTAPTVSATPTPSGNPLPTADTDAIASLVTEVEVIHDYKTDCSKLFTTSFVQEAFGTVALCQKLGFANLSDYPTSASITAITGDGDTATGVVTDHGGLIDGASGPWQFARTRGPGGSPTRVRHICVAFSPTSSARSTTRKVPATRSPTRDTAAVC